MDSEEMKHDPHGSLDGEIHSPLTSHHTPNKRSSCQAGTITTYFEHSNLYPCVQKEHFFFNYKAQILCRDILRRRPPRSNSTLKLARTRNRVHEDRTINLEYSNQRENIIDDFPRVYFGMFRDLAWHASEREKLHYNEYLRFISPRFSSKVGPAPIDP
jgi:hypothetical protein